MKMPRTLSGTERGRLAIRKCLLPKLRSFSRNRKCYPRFPGRLSGQAWVFSIVVPLVALILTSVGAPGQEATSAVVPPPEHESAIAEIRLLRTLPAEHEVYPLMGMESGTYGVAWSPDGERLATYAADSRKVIIWDRGGKVIREIRRYGLDLLAPKTLDFVAGHSQILMAPSVIDPKGEEARNGGNIVSNWENSPLEKILLSRVTIETDGIENIDGPETDKGWRYNEAGTLSVSPDQSMIAVTYGPLNRQKIGIYSTKNWRRIATPGDDIVKIPNGYDFKAVVEALAFSPNGRLLAVGRTLGQVQIYDTTTWGLVRAIDVFPDVPPPRTPMSGVLAFSPDSNSLAVGANHGGSAWILTSGQFGKPGQGTFTINEPPDPVRVFRVSDGTRMASASGFLAGLWLMGTRGLAWSPTNNLVAFISAQGDLHVWNPMHPDKPHAVAYVNRNADSLAFSPDGRLIAISVPRGIDLFEITPKGEK